MNKTLKPFDVYGFLRLNAEKAQTANLPEITSQDWFEGQSLKPHPAGLFSSEIFGPIGMNDRYQRWGYINLKAEILHPHLYKDICSMNHFYESVISGKALATFDAATKSLIPAVTDKSGTGYDFFMKHLPKIVFEKTTSAERDEKIALLNKHIQSGDYTTSALLVLPAGMRDIDTEQEHPTADEINDFYIKMLSISRTIDPLSYKVDAAIYDTQSIALLKCFTQLYEYILNILSGKNGFMYGKLYSRHLQMGTRNVASAMPIRVTHADDESIGTQHTMVGMYQYLQGTSFRSIFEIKDKVINGRLDDYNVQSLVTNINTLKSERVSLTQSQFDRYTSKEGLLSLFNYYGHRPNRIKPAMVDAKHCICLIYDDGKYIKLLNDIEELPQGFNKDFVRPINYTELFTYCLYHTANKTPCIPARYPIATEGSTFISMSHLLVTIESEKRILLGDDWQESSIVYDRWPINGYDYFDGLSVHSTKLKQLAADFDGDTLNNNFLLSSEAYEEAVKVMKSKKYHFKPGGQEIWPPTFATEQFVMASLTL